MAGSDYDILFSKYNNVVARNQDLREQLEKKQTQWSDRDKGFQKSEKNIRDLCESILATDRDEMNLGKATSWGQLSLDELISRASAAFVKYRKEQQRYFSKMTQELDSRREKIHDLENQVDRALSGDRSVTEEDLKAKVNNEKQKGHQSVAFSKPKNDIKIAKKGVVIEDDIDLTPDEEESLEEDMAALNERAKFVKATPSSRTYVPNKKSRQKKKRNQERAMLQDKDSYQEAEQIIDKTDWGWNILQIIGQTGYSVTQDIVNAVMKKHPDYTTSKIRQQLNLIVAHGVLKKDSLNIPLHTNTVTYELTPLGQRVYLSHFKEKAAPSEKSLLESEHDNATHGYGIKTLADIIRDSGHFQSVNEFTRKHPFKFKDGTQYIPDIICEDKNGRKFYLEYEVGTTSQTDLNGKLGKMARVTDTLNIVVPNANVLSHYSTMISKYIQNKGIGTVSSQTIRLCTITGLQGKDISKNSSWKQVFIPKSNGTQPITNF